VFFFFFFFTFDIRSHFSTPVSQTGRMGKLSSQFMIGVQPIALFAETMYRLQVKIGYR